MSFILGMQSRIKTADPIAQSYVIEHDAFPTPLGVRAENGCIRLFVDDKEVGFLQAGCTWAGSIWSDGEVIGEYERTNCGYRVLVVRDGFMVPDETAQQHPLDYLIQVRSQVGTKRF